MRLQLTRRGDYAVRAMLALAGDARGEWLSVRNLAASMGIPVRFLPQVMHDLAAGGLVDGRMGRGGGYRLARPAAQIRLLDIIEAVEGASARTSCVLRGGPCGRDGTCAVHDVFYAAQQALLERLADATLAQLAGRLETTSTPGAVPESPPI